MLLDPRDRRLTQGFQIWYDLIMNAAEQNMALLIASSISEKEYTDLFILH